MRASRRICGHCFSTKTTPREFAGAVRALCETDRASYERMCDAARGRAARFDWSNAMDLTETMYRRAAGRKRPIRRGTLAIPMLLAVAQVLISMLIYRTLQLIAFLGQLRPAAPQRRYVKSPLAVARRSPLQ